jgi:calcineurin-like phosphoesterase family protein
MFRLLHLSDLHFGAHHVFRQRGAPSGVRSLTEAILESLAQATIDPEFDGVILSGDLLYENDPEERRSAREELTQLAGSFGGPMYAIPGNHDVTWEPALAEEPLHFYDVLIDEIPLANGRSDALPAVIEMTKAGARPLGLLLLDSCRFESQMMAGIGRIGDDQLDQLAHRLDESPVSVETHTLAAVLHHHLLPVAPIPLLPEGANPRAGPPPTPSHTVDAVEVLRRLCSLGVSIVLHGHQHWAALMTFEQHMWGGHPIVVAGAGSCAATEPELLRHFFVWELSDTSAKVTSFFQHRDAPLLFEPDRARAAPDLPL